MTRKQKIKKKRERSLWLKLPSETEQIKAFYEKGKTEICKPGYIGEIRELEELDN